MYQNEFASNGSEALGPFLIRYSNHLFSCIRIHRLTWPHSVDAINSVWRQQVTYNNITCHTHNKYYNLLQLWFCYRMMLLPFYATLSTPQYYQLWYCGFLLEEAALFYYYFPDSTIIIHFAIMFILKTCYMNLQKQ